MSEHEELTRRIEELEEEIATLKETVQYLALCKQGDERFRYFDWLVKNGVVGDKQVRFHVVLMTLDLRLAGRAGAVEERPVPGVSSELLYKEEPPTYREAREVLMQVLDTQNDDVVDELFQALMAQGMHRELVALWQRAQGGNFRSAE